MQVRRWRSPVVLLLAVAVGFLLGEAWERMSVWNADRHLFARWGVRPEPLPLWSGKTVSHESEAPSALRFEAMENTGVDFVYDNGPENRFHLAETLGGGVGALDLDRDGAPDLVLIDGGDPSQTDTAVKPRVHLFRNQGEGQFVPVTESGRLVWTSYGHGCAVADVNNDGFDDLLLTGYRQCALFLNQGDGTFVESPDPRRLAADRWCATACWADLDNDGDLDLYITCYADSPPDRPPPFCESRGVRIHCNPHQYGRVSDLLFENGGDGTFHDRSQSSGIAAFQEYGLGVVATDLNGDGVAEIFVANDGDRNLLFRRVSDWVYEDVALTAGLAFNGQGGTMGSMGIACADFDGNGRFDLLTTNFTNESNALFSQQEDLLFVDVSQGTDLERISRPLVGWGAIPLDAEGDGRTDLFIANGHVTQMPGEDWAQYATLLRGTDAGLQEVRQAGAWFEKPWHARGACRLDWNRDGLDDLVVSLIDSPAALLQNQARAPGNRVQLELVGTSAPRSPEGAIVEVECASGKSWHWGARGAGYLSSNSAVLTIGLGKVTSVDVLRIQWPGGYRQEVRNLRAGRKFVVVEGRDQISESPFRNAMHGQQGSISSRIHPDDESRD